MFQGKRYRHRPHKRPLAILAALLLLGLTVGGSIAYLMMETEGVKNTFIPTKVTTEVDEKFDHEVKKDIKIKNTGDINAWIRAAVVITWQNDDGEVYGKKPEYGTDYTMSSLGAGWILGNDDFFYYTSPVEPGKATDVLYEEIKPVEGNDPDGYYLNVAIIGSGIQHKPADVFNDNWGVSSGLIADTACTTLTKAN